MCSVAEKNLLSPYTSCCPLFSSA